VAQKRKRLDFSSIIPKRRDLDDIMPIYLPVLRQTKRKEVILPESRDEKNIEEDMMIDPDTLAVEAESRDEQNIEEDMMIDPENLAVEAESRVNLDIESDAVTAPVILAQKEIEVELHETPRASQKYRDMLTSERVKQQRGNHVIETSLYGVQGLLHDEDAIPARPADSSSPAVVLSQC
jgi:hypothetical protein